MHLYSKIDNIQYKLSSIQSVKNEEERHEESYKLYINYITISICVGVGDIDVGPDMDDDTDLGDNEGFVDSELCVTISAKLLLSDSETNLLHNE